MRRSSRYWSVTRYDDIMHFGPPNHGIFSSEAGSAASPSVDLPTGYDGRAHHDGPADACGAAQDRVADVHAGALWMSWRPDRQRSGKVLDEFAAARDLNFVDALSIELTTQMLATLSIFRSRNSQLTALVRCDDRTARAAWWNRWHSFKEMEEAVYFANLWNERVNSGRRAMTCYR